jgi:hypothetical protein
MVMAQEVPGYGLIPAAAITDSKGNYDGILYNALLLNETDNRVLSFDGTDDYVDLGSTITEMAQEDFTIEVWVKTTSSSDIFSNRW